jgi:hypothetical protein
MRTIGRTLLALAFPLLAAAPLLPAPASAGCGCDKPAPPRAAIRPFVGYPDQTISLFDERLADGGRYWVRFTSTVDGTTDWSRGRAKTRRDFADARYRTQLRVKVPQVGLGPVSIAVYKEGDRTPMYTLGDDAFTVTSRPVVLHDFAETVNRLDYQAGIGRDGTIYVAVDVSTVDGATRFYGAALGFPVDFQAGNVAMYNEQGFLMQLLDPTVPGLFQIFQGDQSMSAVLSYWRHEFRSYKAKHRTDDAFSTDDDPEWHANGTPHIDHDRIVIAIRGERSDGLTLAPGASDPFQLVVMSEREER